MDARCDTRGYYVRVRMMRKIGLLVMEHCGRVGLIELEGSS